jgi:hypothetical protein
VSRWSSEKMALLTKWWARSFLLCLILGIGLAVTDHFLWGMVVLLIGPHIIAGIIGLIILVSEAI